MGVPTILTGDSHDSPENNSSDSSQDEPHLALGALTGLKRGWRRWG